MKIATSIEKLTCHKDVTVLWLKCACADQPMMKSIAEEFSATKCVFKKWHGLLVLLPWTISMPICVTGKVWQSFKKGNVLVHAFLPPRSTAGTQPIDAASGLHQQESISVIPLMSGCYATPIWRDGRVAYRQENDVLDDTLVCNWPLKTCEGWPKSSGMLSSMHVVFCSQPFSHKDPPSVTGSGTLCTWAS